MLTLGVLFFCYARILSVIRKSRKIHENQVSSGNKTDDVNARIQKSVNKTMVMVTVLLVISWTPTAILYKFLSFGFFQDSLVEFQEIWTMTMFIAFIHVCGNPFIYATQYDVVKNRIEWLVSLMSSKSNNQIVVATVELRISGDVP